MSYQAIINGARGLLYFGADYQARPERARPRARLELDLLRSCAETACSTNSGPTARFTPRWWLPHKAPVTVEGAARRRVHIP